MEDSRPSVLVVAGFDQCGGAGILADIKTLEAHGVYGYAVCTGMTFQNERTISRIHWYNEKDIFEQIDLCFATGGFDWVKIGIASSIGMLSSITRHLKQHNPAVRIVLDPVIRASSGKDFWEGTDSDGFDALARECWLVMPNWEEIGWLYPGEDIPEVGRRLSGYCNLYLKGGHHPQQQGRDYLWSAGTLQVLEPMVAAEAVYPKHGSGCVLSSSLAANLSLGYALPVAAARSKRYIEQFLTSNKTSLGWHRHIETSAG